MLTCALYARRKIGLGTYMPGVGHGGLALKSGSDRLDDSLLCFRQQRHNRVRLDYIVLEGTDPSRDYLTN
jgi:hypothetical protein